jgi:hypothetical protein
VVAGKTWGERQIRFTAAVELARAECLSKYVRISGVILFILQELASSGGEENSQNQNERCLS